MIYKKNSSDKLGKKVRKNSKVFPDPIKKKKKVVAKSLKKKKFRFNLYQKFKLGLK